MSARIEGVDLLRGIAVGLVMLRHAWPSLFPGAGVVGVVMFFALSGWLITGVLADEAARTGRVDLRRFYARRARRLVPALLLLVAGVVVVTLLLDPLGDRDELGRTVLVALTWTANLPVGHTSEATFHLWTLATEEQFYLLWPAVLVLALVRGRVRLALLAAGVACLLACVATVLWLREDPDLAYVLPTSWALCFVVGGAARLLARPAGEAAPVRGTWPAAAALVGLAVLSVVPLRGHALTYLAGGPAIAALTVVLLLSWRTWTTVTGPLRALVVLGTVSYGAYLWNYPLTLWLRPSLDGLAGPVSAALTLVMAAVSWHLVEVRAQPVRRTPEAVAA
ncbi:acyltransferase family protein [Nocardioides xinjiangensis]|uniref:acyltransferase family protein n=1 Tax=Nocardioides xinjiangensis TaxID=2817376 RepID=UPI001B30C8F8|nr:acyltransferase [Nocardioides sp. SYSU D00514]